MEETKKIGFDGAFSIDTGLELAGVVGPFVGLDRYATCTERVVCWGGVSTASPMPKSVSFLRKGKRSIVDGFVITSLSSMESIGIYHG